MSPIEALEAELAAATAQARALVEKTDGRYFTLRPEPGRWSVAECLAHLTLSSESFVPVIRAAIDDARRRGLTAKRAPKMDLLGRILRWFLEPPIRKRVQTALPFVPRSIRARADALNEFIRRQDEITALAREASDLDLTNIRIASPFDGRVKYNLYSAFRIITAHERRHLWQAEQTLAEIVRASA